MKPVVVVYTTGTVHGRREVPTPLSIWAPLAALFTPLAHYRGGGRRNCLWKTDSFLVTPLLMNPRYLRPWHIIRDEEGGIYLLAPLLWSLPRCLRRVGNGISFRKIPQNLLGTVSDILREKVLIPMYSEVHRRVDSEARNETELRKKLVLQDSQNNDLFVPQKSSFLILFLKFSDAAFWKNYFKRKFPVSANRIESVFSSA